MPRTSRKGNAKQTATTPAARVWNTAIYARLSVEDGGNKGSDTLETQLSLLNAYVNEKEHLSLFDTYIDNGESGRDFDRPAWSRLMDDIRAGLVDCVCVKDLSRFGRNYIETCEFLEKIFPFMGVRFISANDGYDSEVGGKHSEGLIIALKNLMHDRFLKDVSHKVGQAFQAKKERGEYTGGFAPFGYKLSPNEKGKLVIDEESAPIIKDIFRWRAEGMGLRGICRRLNEMGIPTGGNLHKKMRENTGDSTEPKSLWWTASVSKLIQSRVYLGHLETGKTRQTLGKLTYIPRSEWHITENAHEAIVSEDVWQAANAVKNESFLKATRPSCPPICSRAF
jgi:DNA invertase Pin-like site-specific DNA recombinase